jgi:hypothetical protein
MVVAFRNNLNHPRTREGMAIAKQKANYAANCPNYPTQRSTSSSAATPPTRNP